MLWVYDHYKYFYSSSSGIDFWRQISDVRFWRLGAYGSSSESESDVYRRQILTYKVDPWLPKWDVHNHDVLQKS